MRTSRLRRLPPLLCSVVVLTCCCLHPWHPPQGFIKKLQSELLVQFHRRIGASTGADPAALAPSTTGSHGSSNTQAPGALPGAVGGAAMAQAASNLSAFKASMNSFTRELASSMSISSNTSGLGSPATSYSSPGSTQVMGSKVRAVWTVSLSLRFSGAAVYKHGMPCHARSDVACSISACISRGTVRGVCVVD